MLSQEALDYRKQILRDRYHKAVEQITSQYINDVNKSSEKDTEAINKNFHRQLELALEELMSGFRELVDEEKIERRSNEISDADIDEELRRIVQRRGKL